MKSILFLFLLFWIPAGLRHQEQDAEIRKICDTARDAAYLSRNEKDVILYLNLARAYPSEFLEHYLNDAAARLGQEKTQAFRSLLKELGSAKAAGLLVPSRELWETAHAHAVDMGTTGKMGHTSSKGKNFEQRLKKFPGEIAENCDYGNEDPLLIVSDLLIDDHVPGMGHRKNILNPRLRQCGVSIEPHKKYHSNCVMDFAS